MDAAPAYDDVFGQHPEIIEVGCMAHARRYFKEAMPTAAVVCAQVLALIGQLYGIERAANDRQFDALVPQSKSSMTYSETQIQAALPRGHSC